MAGSYYEKLISHGVKIYEFTPGFLHAKSFVVDDEVAMVGTINMDYRSFQLHYECGVMLYGAAAIAEVRKDMEGIISRSAPGISVRRGWRSSPVSGRATGRTLPPRHWGPCPAIPAATCGCRSGYATTSAETSWRNSTATAYGTGTACGTASTATRGTEAGKRRATAAAAHTYPGPEAGR